MFHLFSFLLIFSLALSSETIRMADRVLVKKSTRMLYLSAGGKIYKKYHISLGIMPKGAKEIRGDMRTPEGKYILDWRQTSQLYNLSLHVSYPNEEDKKHAKELGESAGSMIMVHGTPSNWSLSPIGDWMPLLLDWTEGCIALDNDDMQEVWDRTSNGIPIFIIP